MTSQPKTLKPAYYKTGDWQLLRRSGLWLQRQHDGPLWLIGSGGLFMALDLSIDTEFSFDESRRKLIIESKDSRRCLKVAMGSLLQIKQFLPMSLRLLRRQHPGYLAPNYALRSQASEFKYREGAYVFTARLKRTSNGFEITFRQNSPVVVNKIWRQRPPLSSKLADYTEWYLQAVWQPRAAEHEPTLSLPFYQQTKNYLKLNWQHQLRAELTQQFHSQEFAIKSQPQGPASFINYAKATARLSWWYAHPQFIKLLQPPNSIKQNLKNIELAWFEHLFNTQARIPDNLVAAVTALATPINNL